MKYREHLENLYSELCKKEDIIAEDSKGDCGK